MKQVRISRGTVFFLILALALITAGIVLGVQLSARFETLALTHTDHSQLVDALRATAFYAMICGSLVVAGVGILVIAVLHLMRRTARNQREAEALRRKNEAMQELNQKIQQLTHHQRLETIGTLTASIAHEFNNLLTPIMGHSMMALEKLPPEEEELYDSMIEIYNASRRAKIIISRLSDLSRKNTDDTFRIVSPDDVIRKNLDVVRPAKPKNVEVRLDLNCWEQRIRANEIQLSQLLLNLILNGFQAMEPGPGVLTIRSTFDETHIHICVSDTGCGIPQEHLERIFEPFFTTKESGSGTGLGLAIAAQVVEDHQGRIWVDSRVGEGTEFVISLPRTNFGKTS